MNASTAKGVDGVLVEEMLLLSVAKIPDSTDQG